MNCNFRQRIVVVLVALFVAGAAVGQLRAQTYANVSGFVTDQSGAAIPEVALKLQSEATGEVRTTSSNSVGEYAFTLIPPGTYTLTVAKPGFVTASITKVVVDVNTASRHDIRLSVSSVKQEVTVQANPVQVNTETAGMGSVVKSREMVDLPLNGRDFLQLSLLSAGVAPPPTQNGQSTAMSLSHGGARQTEVVDVSGTREQSEIVMFDGIPEKQFLYGLTALQPPVDSIAEFKIQQGYYSPQFAAPAIINVATKSGTNSVHGAAWEFLRNDALNARNFFDTDRAPYKQNQFGASVGGPAIKNKLFWFGDYEGFIVHQYNTQSFIQPTAQMLSGDFSALSTPIYDPATWDPVTQTRQPFAGNVIPPDRISNFAKAYNQWIPAPNTAPIASLGGANLVGTALNPQKDNKWDARVDVDWSSANRFFGRVSRLVSAVDTNSLNKYQDEQSPLTAMNVVFGWTHIFTPTIVNDFHAGLDRAYLTSGDPANSIASGPNYPQQVGLANIGGIPQCNGVPSVSLGPYSSQGGGNCTINGNSDKLFMDNLNIVHGRHTISMGFEIRRVNWKLLNGYQVQGSLSFSGQYSGDAVADYLLGDAFTAGGGMEQMPSYRRAFWPNVYVNDDFHVTSKLTVNYGLGWIYTPPPSEKYDNLWGFDFTQGQMVRCGTQLNGVAMPAGCFNRHWLDFSPRLGFAYSPAKDWAIRASYGIFWDRIPGNEWVFSAAGWPFSNSYSYQGDPNVPTIDLTQLFPAPTPPGAVPPVGTGSTSLGPPDRKDPYLHQWTLSVQHTLPGNVFLEMAYVGSKGTHLSKRMDANLDPAPPAPGDTRSVQDRRPYQPFGYLLFDYGNANSEYEGLQFTARKPVGHGLSFMSGFTYAKSLDNDSYDNKATRNYRPGDMDKGRSVFDIKYRLTAGVVYDLPVGRSTTGAMRQLIAGWQLGAILTDQTGVPFEVLTDSDFSNTGGFWSPRPNRICDGNLPGGQRSPVRWFDTSCFVNPAQNTYGNGGVAYLNTDGLHSLDLSLSKDFHLTEHTALQFRAEAFNSLNVVNFDQPGNNVPVDPSNSGGFGIVTSAEAPRLFQFGLKLIF